MRWPDVMVKPTTMIKKCYFAYLRGKYIDNICFALSEEDKGVTGDQQSIGVDIAGQCDGLPSPGPRVRLT